MTEIYWAAFDDHEEAIAQVRKVAGASSDTKVSVVALLHPSAAAYAKITAGEVRSAI